MSDKKSAWELWKENLGDTRPWDMLNPAIQQVDASIAEHRFSICKSCPELIKPTNQCKKCGCIMNLKTKLPHAECPIGLWGKFTQETA